MNNQTPKFKSKSVALFREAAAHFVVRGPQAKPAKKGEASPWRTVPGTSLPGEAGGSDHVRQSHALCHEKAQEFVSSGRAVRVVTGWCVELLDKKASGQITLILGHHSVVEMDNGQWLCPNTRAGSSIDFFEDTGRAFDPRLRFNHLLVSNRAISRVGAFTPAWYTQLGSLSLLSTDQRHAQCVEFAKDNPFYFALSLGCDHRSVVDLAFLSDLDRVIKATPELRGWRPLDAPRHEQEGVLEELEEAWLTLHDTGADDNIVEVAKAMGMEADMAPSKGTEPGGQPA